MKNIILSFSILLIYTACETGTNYEKNTTVEKVQEDHSIRDLIEGSPSATALVKKSYIEEKESTINRSIAHKYDPENPLNSDEFVENSYVEEEIPKTEESFSGGNITDGLNVKSIRVGYHATYTRLVFDIEQNGEKAKKVGSYNVDYNAETGIISVTLNGYSDSLAKLPTFSSKSVVEKISFNNDDKESGFKFSIKLRDSASVKAYDYKNPARLIIDIKPF
jgi:hypothetical protein